MTNPPTLREALEKAASTLGTLRRMAETDAALSYTAWGRTAYDLYRDIAKRAENEARAALSAKVPEDDLVERLAAALEPFAEIGVWLFASDLPDETPVFEFSRLNQPNGFLTRGHFKAAHTAVLEAADRIEALGSHPTKQEESR